MQLPQTATGLKLEREPAASKAKRRSRETSPLYSLHLTVFLTEGLRAAIRNSILFSGRPVADFWQATVSESQSSAQIPFQSVQSATADLWVFHAPWIGRTPWPVPHMPCLFPDLNFTSQTDLDSHEASVLILHITSSSENDLLSIGYCRENVSTLLRDEPLAFEASHLPMLQTPVIYMKWSRAPITSSSIALAFWELQPRALHPSQRQHSLAQGGRRSRDNDVTFDNREEVRQGSMTTHPRHLDQSGGHQSSKKVSYGNIRSQFSQR
ncbi:hypothetical protein SRHO_G00121130 [Serrasalmus rhombeus]